MVRIPSYNVPQVGTQATQQPSLSLNLPQPIVNQTAEQTARLGQAVSNLGAGLYQVGVQDQVTQQWVQQQNERIELDKATADSKSALNIWYEKGNEILDQYKQSLGPNAKAGYQDFIKNLDSQRSEIEKGIKNPVARQLWSLNADRFASQFRADGTRHYDKQVLAHRISSSEGMIDVLKRSAVKAALDSNLSDVRIDEAGNVVPGASMFDPQTGKFVPSLDTYFDSLLRLDNEMNEYAAATQTPTDSPQFQAWRNKQLDEMHTDIAKGLIADGRTGEAQAYVAFVGDQIQDPKVRSQINETVNKANRAAYIDNVESVVLAESQKPISIKYKNAEGQEVSFEKTPRLMDAATRMIDDLLQRKQITGEEAQSLRTKFNGRQQAMDDSASTLRTQALNEFEDWRAMNPSATMDDLVRGNIELYEKLQSSNAIGHAIGKMSNNGGTTRMGRAYMALTDQELLEIGSESKLRDITFQHLSTSDYTELARRFRTLTKPPEPAKPQEATEAQFKSMLEAYFATPSYRDLYQPEIVLSGERTGQYANINQGINQRNQTRQLRRVMAENQVRGFAQILAGPNRQPTMDDYNKAILRFKEQETVKLKEMMADPKDKEEIERELQIPPDLLTDEELKIAQWNVSPRAMSLWKAMGRNVTDLVAVASATGQSPRALAENAYPGNKDALDKWVESVFDAEIAKSQGPVREQEDLFLKMHPTEQQELIDYIAQNPKESPEESLAYFRSRPIPYSMPGSSSIKYFELEIQRREAAKKAQELRTAAEKAK